MRASAPDPVNRVRRSLRLRPPTARRPPRPDYLARLCAAVEQLVRSRYLLDEVIELADESPELTAAQLRDRLTALADRTRHRGTPTITDPRPTAG